MFFVVCMCINIYILYTFCFILTVFCFTDRYFWSWTINYSIKQAFGLGLHEVCSHWRPGETPQSLGESVLKIVFLLLEFQKAWGFIRREKNDDISRTGPTSMVELLQLRSDVWVGVRTFPVAVVLFWAAGPTAGGFYVPRDKLTTKRWICIQDAWTRNSKFPENVRRQHWQHILIAFSRLDDVDLASTALKHLGSWCSDTPKFQFQD